MWRRLLADGCEWEVRAIARQTTAEKGEDPGEIIEFRCVERFRPPRQLAVPTGALERMDEAALRSAYRQARPIGAETYGRPGKRMHDGSG